MKFIHKKLLKNINILFATFIRTKYALLYLFSLNLIVVLSSKKTFDFALIEIHPSYVQKYYP